MSSNILKLEEHGSSWKVIKKSCSDMNKGRLVIIMMCILFLVYGCAGKKTGFVPQKKVSIGDVQLTPEQKRIFYTTGQLDRDLPAGAMPAIAEQYSLFLNERRSTMEKFAQRSEPFLGHARQIFRQNGMPEELAYLALVESGYLHTARSHAGAAGTWQFMPYTGKHYGLHQDRYIDERLDPYESVEAAAKYFRTLHNMFGDWLLAAAAYNAGQGKIQRAMKATGARDYFTLLERNHRLSGKTKLRTETILYVPRLLAMSKIMRNLTALGFSRVDHNRPAQHVRLSVRPGTDLRKLARAVGVPYDEFRAINAAHKKHTTHRNRSTYVYVPVSQKENGRRFAESRGSTVASATYADIAPRVRSTPLPRTTSKSKGNLQARAYIVKSGDSLSRIAARYNVSTNDLARFNKIGKNSRLSVGQRINIPRGAQLSGASKARASRAKRTHLVKRGDTATSIASKYNLTIKQLLKMNKKRSSDLRAGEVLQVS